MQDTEPNLGVIRNGYPSYTGTESYDVLNVLSAGGVPCLDRQHEIIEKENPLEIYYQVYNCENGDLQTDLQHPSRVLVKEPNNR